MNTITEKYILGLKKAYYDNNAQESWEHFANIKHGASKADIESIKEIFPDIPETLISLLEYVDGTYWRKYADEKIAFYFLGSDVEGYPYYLLSSKEIIDNQNQAVEYYSDYIERKYDEVEMDDKIANEVSTIKWLHFSDCMNNGGTSQLFIDFSPSLKGKKGQVIRFLHDPDEFKVIADSFEGYLKKLTDNEYDFINDDILD
jgi:hypothetical protein